MKRRTWLPLVGLVFGCSSTDPAASPTDSGSNDALAVDAPPKLTYPAGPYGLKVGDVFPNVSFDGYREGNAGPLEWTQLSMLDYYDPTGTRGIHAVLVVVSAEWCGPCRMEARSLPGFYTKLYKARGARFLTAMTENASKEPADRSVVDRWIKSFGINFDIVADPRGSVMPSTDRAIPRNYLVNPRDMKIVRIQLGTNPEAVSVPGLGTLLDATGAPALGG